jgi:hypothetical protein
MCRWCAYSVKWQVSKCVVVVRGRLAVTALLAACTENKTIADEKSARTAIAEEAANATD